MAPPCSAWFWPPQMSGGGRPLGRFDRLLETESSTLHATVDRHQQRGHRLATSGSVVKQGAVGPITPKPSPVIRPRTRSRSRLSTSGVTFGMNPVARRGVRRDTTRIPREVGLDEDRSLESAGEIGRTPFARKHEMPVPEPTSRMVLPRPEDLDKHRVGTCASERLHALCRDAAPIERCTVVKVPMATARPAVGTS